MFLYRELQEHEVDQLKVEMAEKLMNQACPELGIDRPQIKWFVEADLSEATFKHEPAILGGASPDEGIMVKGDEDYEQTGETVLHELRHCQHFKLYPGQRFINDEDRAEAFGRKECRDIIQHYANRVKRANNFRISFGGR